MGNVSFLPVDERVDVDGALLSEVMRQLGPETAERLIEDALAGMQVELAEVAALVAAVASAGKTCAEDHGNPEDSPARLLADLLAATDRLSRTAWEFGLTTLSGVSIDLALCAERSDHTALGAVGARLQRVGRRSLGPAWDEATFG
ncbi:hypothetical protein DRW48_02385 [Paracoccus suum]|uniref:HPt domain-containing protein n=2 Tax=Paracoccus suum TaxID=2259340 RepID=A0A344PH33_9RHOB|nr:hypothetical protein DRW48_02385 [Paracoccus suum]